MERLMLIPQKNVGITFGWCEFLFRSNVLHALLFYSASRKVIYISFIARVEDERDLIMKEMRNGEENFELISSFAPDCCKNKEFKATCC